MRCGFTLIELLVVVAIIALLISILLPSLNRARAMSRSAVCKSNLHQVGLALQIHLMENKDWIPRGTADTSMVDWVGMTLKSLGYRWNTNSSLDPQKLIPVNKHKVFRCPERQRQDTIGPRIRNELLLDYVANCVNDTGPPWNPPTNTPTKISIWPYPARTVYLADAATERENAKEMAAVDAATGKMMSILQYGRAGRTKASDPPGQLHEFDFWAPKHFPVDSKVQLVPANYRDMLRISRKMHMGYSANCLFVDGHAEGVKHYGMDIRRWLLMAGVKANRIPNPMTAWD